MQAASSVLETLKRKYLMDEWTLPTCVLSSSVIPVLINADLSIIPTWVIIMLKVRAL